MWIFVIGLLNVGWVIILFSCVINFIMILFWGNVNKEKDIVWMKNGMVYYKFVNCVESFLVFVGLELVNKVFFFFFGIVSV